MKIKAGDQVAVGAFVIAAVLTAAVYDRLPLRLPTHYDLHGVPDGWMDRSIGAWIVLGLGGVVWLATRFTPRLSRKWRENLEASPVATVGAITMSLVCAVQLVMIHAALSEPHRIGNGLAVVMCGAWFALGLVLPRVRRNRWIGVRTPWTMASDENWARTHRVAGYSFACGGVVSLIVYALGQVPLAAICLIGSGAVPVIYSFALSRGAGHSS